MIRDINKSLYNFSKSLLLALKGEFYLQETRIKVNIAGIPLQCTNNKNLKIIEHPPINRNCQRNMYSTSGFWTQIWDIWLRNLKYVHCDNCSSRDRLGYLCRDSDYFWDKYSDGWPHGLSSDLLKRYKTHAVSPLSNNQFYSIKLVAFWRTHFHYFN